MYTQSRVAGCGVWEQGKQEAFGIKRTAQVPNGDMTCMLSTEFKPMTFWALVQIPHPLSYTQKAGERGIAAQMKGSRQDLWPPSLDDSRAEKLPPLSEQLQ